MSAVGLAVAILVAGLLGAISGVLLDGYLTRAPVGPTQEAAANLNDLLTWLAPYGITLDDLPGTDWPIEWERSTGGQYEDDRAHLSIPVFQYNDDGSRAFAVGRRDRRTVRVPLGIRAELCAWLREQGADPDLTTEHDCRIKATDPPFLMTRCYVTDGTRRLVDVTGDRALTEERAYRLRSLPVIPARVA